jgi:hypothetical protein
MNLKLPLGIETMDAAFPVTVLLTALLAMACYRACMRELYANKSNRQIRTIQAGNSLLGNVDAVDYSMVQAKSLAARRNAYAKIYSGLPPGSRPPGMPESGDVNQQEIARKAFVEFMGAQRRRPVSQAELDVLFARRRRGRKK